MKTKTIIAALLLFYSAFSWAATQMGSIWYILNHDNMTASVTCYHDYDDPNNVYGESNTIMNSSCYKGDISIPESVTYNGQIYSVTEIGYRAFYQSYNLSSITIPNSVTNIRNDAFMGCEKLISATIGDSVKTIGDGAFYNCGSLTTISIPNSVTKINAYAFTKCSELVSVVMGNSVRSIGHDAFKDCRSLASVNIPESITSIGSSAFQGCGLTSLSIPNSVTKIESYVFYSCNFLNSVDLGNSVTSIGQYAFARCFMDSITIPESVTTIEKGAFRENSLKEITLPNSVTNIGEEAFGYCYPLISVSIGNNVTNIGKKAFIYCYNMTSFTNNTLTPQTINENVFSEVDLSTCTLYVPNESIELYKTADVWKKFNRIVSLDDLDSVEEVNSPDSQTIIKILQEGQLLILRGDKTYTLQGQEVK